MSTVRKKEKNVAENRDGDELRIKFMKRKKEKSTNQTRTMVRKLKMQIFSLKSKIESDPD